MPNPLGSITPILDLLGKELKILPATEEITGFAETPFMNRTVEELNGIDF